MALPALSLKEVRAMNEAERTAYFDRYSRYFADSPLRPYCLRIGSRTLYSNDTMDLREQFDKLLTRKASKAPKTILHFQ